MDQREDGATSFGGRVTPPSTPIPPLRTTEEVIIHASPKRPSSSKSRSSSSDSSLRASPEPVAFAQSQPSIITQDSDTRNLIAKPKESWFAAWSPTLILENSGSVARDHLASERTFLAYMRTSLTIASTGVALVQLFTISASSNKALEKYSRPIGAVVISIGLATLLLGLVRFFAVQKALVGGHYPVARVSTMLLATSMSAIVVAVFAIIVGVR